MSTPLAREDAGKGILASPVKPDTADQIHESRIVSHGIEVGRYFDPLQDGARSSPVTVTATFPQWIAPRRSPERGRPSSHGRRSLTRSVRPSHHESQEDVSRVDRTGVWRNIISSRDHMTEANDSSVRGRDFR